MIGTDRLRGLDDVIFLNTLWKLKPWSAIPETSTDPADLLPLWGENGNEFPFGLPDPHDRIKRSQMIQNTTAICTKVVSRSKLGLNL